jgi:hypothetical protein
MVHCLPSLLHVLTEKYCVSVPEHRISDEFTHFQHPLNIASVSKRLQTSIIKLLPAAQLDTNALDNMNTA